MQTAQMSSGSSIIVSRKGAGEEDVASSIVATMVTA